MSKITLQNHTRLFSDASPKMAQSNNQDFELSEVFNVKGKVICFFQTTAH